MYTVSISSRGLMYLPLALQKELNIEKESKVRLKVVGKGKLQVSPLQDIFSMAGSLKSPKNEEFDLSKWRQEQEKEYARL